MLSREGRWGRQGAKGEGKGSWMRVFLSCSCREIAFRLGGEDEVIDGGLSFVEEMGRGW